MKPGIVLVSASTQRVAEIAAAIGVAMPVIPADAAAYAAVYQDQGWADHYAELNRQAGNVTVLGRGTWQGRPAVVAVAR